MKRSASGLLTRSMAAVALVLLYGLSTVGVSGLIGTSKAEARGRRGGRGGGRGGRGGFRGARGFRGGRRGFGRRGGIWLGAPALYGYGYNDSCYWSPRRGRYVCPYPGYYNYYW
jgi:hypothetical protein